MRKKAARDFVILPTNYISQQNPLPTLEALKMHPLERKKSVDVVSRGCPVVAAVNRE